LFNYVKLTLENLGFLSFLDVMLAYCLYVCLMSNKKKLKKKSFFSKINVTCP